ncbi:DUF4652 domain-containing protein [Paenibacillus tengchongensis]|uniref:DUF4652 domain-containing protein n=1 Tax=Paenibacillus tengchongensis TaxID=2608684 RepID=UPI00124D4460|nr:DUF4652 domain-containing protein [Paenibacillus tengchongensis]
MESDIGISMVNTGIINFLLKKGNAALSRITNFCFSKVGIFLLRSALTLCLLISLFLVGCSNERSINSSSELIMDESVLYPENEPPFIKIKREGEWEEISRVDDYPSKPEISSNKTKLAFISPFEFEMAGDVWLYDLLINEKKKIFNQDQAGKGNSAKDVLWVDNSNLVILIGDTIGTISSNHTLYLLNIKDNKLQQIFQAENNQDLRDLKIVNGKSISFEIVTYNEESTDHASEIKTLDITNFISEGTPG